MNPELWGNHAWKFLHYITLNYPETPTFSDKMKYTTFLNSFAVVLPCEDCSNHFKELLSKTNFDIVLSSKDSFFKWSVDVHNHVNRRLHKKTLSYNDSLNSLLKLPSRTLYDFVKTVVKNSVFFNK